MDQEQCYLQTCSSRSQSVMRLTRYDSFDDPVLHPCSGRTGYDGLGSCPKRFASGPIDLDTCPCYVFINHMIQSCLGMPSKTSKPAILVLDDSAGSLQPMASVEAVVRKTYTMRLLRWSDAWLTRCRIRTAAQLRPLVLIPREAHIYRPYILNALLR